MYVYNPRNPDRTYTNLLLAISVIRMIKLFGWESRVAEQLYGVRGEELRLVRKRKLLSLINNNMK